MQYNITPSFLSAYLGRPWSGPATAGPARSRSTAPPPPWAKASFPDPAPRGQPRPPSWWWGLGLGLWVWGLGVWVWVWGLGVWVWGLGTAKKITIQWFFTKQGYISRNLMKLGQDWSTRRGGSHGAIPVQNTFFKLKKQTPGTNINNNQYPGQNTKNNSK